MDLYSYCTEQPTVDDPHAIQILSTRRGGGFSPVSRVKFLTGIRVDTGYGSGLEERPD